MGNIIVNATDLICESPVIGNTYRNISGTGNYTFNWTSILNVYASYGLIVEVKIFILPENVPPEQEYTGSTVPYNANNFSIGILNYDEASFRIEFLVDNGDTCYYSFNIPYSSIIIT